MPFYLNLPRSRRYHLADRVQKLKDARAEAAKEIEAYRAQKDKEYNTFESDVSGFVISAF